MVWNKIKNMNNREFFVIAHDYYKKTTTKKLCLKIISGWLFISSKSLEPYRFTPESKRYRILSCEQKRLIFLELRYNRIRKNYNNNRINRKKTDFVFRARQLAKQAYREWKTTGKTVLITLNDLIEIYIHAVKTQSAVRLINRRKITVTKNDLYTKKNNNP